MTLKQRRLRRQSLRSWVKWTPVLAAVFTVLALEAYCNVKLRANDYELGTIYRQLEIVHNEMVSLRASESNLASVDRLALEATDLGLVTAKAGQIETVYFELRPDAITPPPVPYVLASAEAPDATAKDETAIPGSWKTAAIAVAAAPLASLDDSVPSLLAEF